MKVKFNLFPGSHSSSLATHPHFCVASSILVLQNNYLLVSKYYVWLREIILVPSWASTTLQRATVMEPIHLSSTPYIRGSFPVTWSCLLMKRVKRRLGALEKRMLQPASRYYVCMDGKPRDASAKEGMVALFFHRVPKIMA